MIEDISSKSLQKSNHALALLSSTNYQAISEKLNDKSYGDRVGPWHNKATKLKTLTSNILQQLEGLDIKNKNANDLLSKLKRNYITDIISLDSNIKQEFKSDIDSCLIEYGITFSPLFNNEKAKNDILVLEARLSSYFNNKLAMIIEDYTTFSTIIGQNTSHLKFGETLEIKAGIGSFTTAAKPTFEINGEIITPNEDAVAVYKLKVDGKGTKSIPVKISFTGSDGQKETKEFVVEYFVEN